MNNGRNISIGDISDAYTGAVGTLWEMVMGEEIHIGGSPATRELASMAGIGKESRVLDICSALGGPARHLAGEFGCMVTGIDATVAMVEEATRRTATAVFNGRVNFRLGNALDLPFKKNSFDIVWGQDAWCYVTDKERLIHEAGRVITPGGTRLLEKNGWEVTVDEDLSCDFALQFSRYLVMIRGELRPEIIRRFGDEFYGAVEKGIVLWEKAAHEGKVGRGLWIAKKTVT